MRGALLFDPSARDSRQQSREARVFREFTRRKKSGSDPLIEKCRIFMSNIHEWLHVMIFEIKHELPGPCWI